MEASDCAAETQEENPDLEDGEIEDDDDEEEVQVPTEENVEPQIQNTPEQILPAPIPTDTNIFKRNEPHNERKRRHSTEKKGERHLTEAEKSVRYLHKLERAERERRERLRKEQFGPTDDWAGNIEKAIASVLKKADTTSAGEEVEEEEKKRGKKRKKKGRDRPKKQRKSEERQDEVDEEEMLQVFGGSPENKVQKELSPCPEGEGYESYDSEYDSDNNFYQNRPNKRKFEKNRRNRDGTKRERKNFKEKQREKRQNEQNRPILQDGNSICMFYMQGKCHKGDDCPYSHDALPPLKMELCKFYLMDCCAKRDKCLYMHSEFPCKFYHTGLKCFAKDNCKFAHGKPLNDTLKQILLKHLETAPKEILGDFPRLSREGAQNLVNQTQKMLETQHGVKNGAPAQSTEKSSIPSLFDITVPIPLELMNQNMNPNMNVANNIEDQKPKQDKPEKKVRQTRWNNDPPIPLAQINTLPFVNPVFNSLTLQDQQKLQEYQMNFQMKGFYSESDQDMRKALIMSNGDVDMRSLQLSKTEPPKVDLSTAIASKMDTDHRQPLTLAHPTYKTDSFNQPSVIDDKVESNLTIDEKSGDSGCDLPSNLPKKQRELFLRIQAQQKENLLENQKDDDDDGGMLKDDDWYSSDDDNDPSSKMVIHLEEEEKPKEDIKSPPHILSPPTIKPEVIDKLGDLSKIDISAEVTKLLTSIKNTNQQSSNNKPSNNQTTADAKNPRDPRQAHNLTSESGTSNVDPRTKGKDRRESSTSIYEQGYATAEQKQLSIYEQGLVRGQDVDLRSLDSLSKDLDMRSVAAYGDTDLRAGGRQDVDLRQLNLPFKAIQNYTPATEIDASIGSHSPIPYRVHIVDIPRPDYSGLKLSALDSQVNSDPRLRKIFRVPSTEEKDSPASPSHQPNASPPKTARADPRRRPNLQKTDDTTKDTSNMTYAQQLQLLQNSAFYQSLTSNQKLMLNQEIASKADQNTPNDPILTGILSNIGLINNVTQNNSSATNILANVNSLVPNMMGPNQMGPMGQNVMPNIGTGLLGAAPGVPMMPNVPNMAPNDFQINFDPRNGGLLGPAPFQNFQDNQNFGQFNDDFYPDNNDGNFGGNFNNRNNRNFRNDNRNQNNRRGRQWNNRHNNNRNNRNNNNNNNRNRANRSYTPP